MKLSEAIRLGSMLGPQARGHLTSQRRKFIFFGPVVNAYCALGAAFAASGARTVERVYESDEQSSAPFRGASVKTKAGEAYRAVDHPWGALMWEREGCPMCPGEMYELYRLIPHLNDDHKWSRERIADLIATIESREAILVNPARDAWIVTFTGSQA